MSGTASLPSEVAPPRTMYAVWLSVASGCALWMTLAPSFESIPFHAGVAAFALLYGYQPWPWPRAWWSTTAYLTYSATVIVMRAIDGAVSWTEVAEIPLVAVFAMAVLLHVHRRQKIMAALAARSAADRQLSRARERLTSTSSHELRTPLTIARGYVEHLLTDEPNAERREDLCVIQEELETLSRVTDRLLRAISTIGEAPPQRAIDVSPVVSDVVRRWSLIERRHWVVDAVGQRARVADDRLRAALDTLVENAVRYTHDGDTVRVFARPSGDGAVDIGVADSGRGMSPGLIEHLNAAATADPQREDSEEALLAELRDVQSQTGWGLSLVRGIAATCDGRIAAGAAPEGGAMVWLSVPSADAPRGEVPASV